MYNDFIKQTFANMAKIKVNHSIDYDLKTILQTCKNNEPAIKDKIDSLINEVKKDYETASLGLKTKKPTTLQKSVFSVSYTHATCELAWFILELNNIKKSDYIKSKN